MTDKDRDPDPPEEDKEPAPPSLRDRIREEMPWIPLALLDTFIKGYEEYGEDAERAWEYVRREDPQYDKFFGGNLRDDGTARYTEKQYMQVVNDFRSTLEAVGVNPRVFEGRFRELIEGEVSPNEFFSKVSALTERVNLALPEMQAWYAGKFNLDLSRAGILAAAFDPKVGEEILNKRITMAEIGGEGAARDFEIKGKTARRLYEAGIGRDEAANLFGAAATAIPALSVLARRHADPDDDFDLNDFLGASVFDNPEERQRMRRLIAQEEAGFSQSGALGVLRDQQGGQRGLQRR